MLLPSVTAVDASSRSSQHWISLVLGFFGDFVAVIVACRCEMAWPPLASSLGDAPPVRGPGVGQVLEQWDLRGSHE